ncbi:MAG: DUF707 domain-containing protein [Aquamicrobium sp.]|uniref:DUF707 domain-containing protein n=1 Tax=Aquamicrobium sp. TaxID=1872579 RepID=UPI00349EFB4A|nr:DUF707 domain-containing protein [Aquamicrobium sp.]MCO5158573.1 DUF707 domain-containing protein [Aquamicrobium sp.]
MKRRNLVVVRAGRTSLHGRWLERPYAERNYDLLVSYYDEEAFNAFEAEDGAVAVLVGGGKWDGLHRTLTGLDIEAYDYFWLPDDDIAATAADVNAIFDLCRANGLAIAQPALTRDSYFSHFIFSQCPGFRLRYTNYIEIMAPCLNREILLRALPLFRDTMSGFGLDYIWCRWPESGAFRVAILDTVAVHHTRPVGQVLKAAMAASGRPAPAVEEQRLRERFALDGRTVPLSFAGILDSGEPVTGRLGMGMRMCLIWWKDRHAFRDRREALRGIAKVARRQIVKPLELSTLEARRPQDM